MAITLTFSTLLTISRPSRYPNCALPSGLLCTRFRSENKAGTCSLFARITYEVKERERNCCCFFKKKKKKIKKDHCVRCFIFIRGDCKKRVDRSDLLRLRLLFIVHPNFLAWVCTWNENSLIIIKKLIASVRLFVHLYIYIYYIYTYLFIYIYLYLFIRIGMRMYTCTRLLMITE